MSSAILVEKISYIFHIDVFEREHVMLKVIQNPGLSGRALYVLAIGEFMLG